MDTKLSTAQADPRDDGDLVLLAKDWTGAEEALSKLAHVAANPRRPRAGSDFSAGPRVAEPSLGDTLRAADATDDLPPTDRPSPGGRPWRRVARFLLAACIGVAATLAWQSYGDAARQMIASSVPPLGWLLLPPPAIDPTPGSEIAVEQPNPSAIQASVPPPASAQAATAASTAPETAASAPSPELRQQLETMVHELAGVRQSVEQLSAGQEQIASDIAKLQAAEQDIRRRVAALPPAAAPTVHKPAPPPQVAPQSSIAPPPLPQAAPQSSTAPLPPPPSAPQSSAVPLPPTPPEPPRPPMPLR
jgi:hypothetical protein